MRTIFSLAFITICFLLFSCAGIKDLEVKDISGFKVSQISMKGVDSELMISINNPNRFGFTIYPSEFEVKYSDVYLGKAILLNKVKIKGKTEESYNFILKNDFKEVNLMDVMKLLSTGSFKNLIEISGDLKAGNFLLKKKFKVEYKEAVGLN